MKNTNRFKLLDAMIRHETLTINDIGKPENLGYEPKADQLKLLLYELTESGHLAMLSDVTPATYTITTKGIEEGNRLREEV